MKKEQKDRIMGQFRGIIKGIDTPKARWAYGDKFEINGRVYIVLDDAEVESDYLDGFIEVIPETVGLCSGVVDKHHKSVYQGDIVRCWKLQDTVHPKGDDYGTEGMIDGYATAVIKFDGWEFWFKQLSGSEWFFYEPDGISFDPRHLNEEFRWMEIIGNIHDNPELLEIKNE